MRAIRTFTSIFLDSPSNPWNSSHQPPSIFIMAFMSCRSDLAPLLRLFDHPELHRARPTTTRSFAPAFDVRELTDSYYLDGELPGVDQKNIEIEFSDPHTLVIQGRTERNYRLPNQKENTSTSWRQPTVEDEDSESNNTDTDTDDTVDHQSQPESFHYWNSERSIGEFKRVFTFPTRVNQDAVRANLSNGILSLVVPKDAVPKTKKIRIE